MEKALDCGRCVGTHTLDCYLYEMEVPMAFTAGEAAGAQVWLDGVGHVPPVIRRFVEMMWLEDAHREMAAERLDFPYSL